MKKADIKAIVLSLPHIPIGSITLTAWISIAPSFRLCDA